MRTSESGDPEKNIQEGKGLSDQPVSRAHGLTLSPTARNNCLRFHDAPGLEASNANGSLRLTRAGEDGDADRSQPQMHQKDTPKTCTPCNTPRVFPTEGVRFPYSLSSPPARSLKNLGCTPFYPLTCKKGASTAQPLPGCNGVQLLKICPTLILRVIKIFDLCFFT